MHIKGAATAPENLCSPDVRLQCYLESRTGSTCRKELDGRPTLLVHELALALHDLDALAVLLDMSFWVRDWLALLGMRALIIFQFTSKVLPAAKADQRDNNWHENKW